MEAGLFCFSNCKFLAGGAIVLSVALSGDALFASWKGSDKSDHPMMIGSLRIHHRKTTFQVSKCLDTWDGSYLAVYWGGGVVEY
jgi:hypothetical protein